MLHQVAKRGFDLAVASFDRPALLSGTGIGSLASCHGRWLRKGRHARVVGEGVLDKRPPEVVLWGLGLLGFWAGIGGGRSVLGLLLLGVATVRWEAVGRVAGL